MRPGIKLASVYGMTRINRTNAQTYRPFRAPGTTRAAGRSAQRITVTQAELVNDEPVEEVIFEPNGSVDQRAAHRGYVITEPVEDILAERRDRALSCQHFWQGFSAPFMAQVIGQHIAGPDPRFGAYGRPRSITSEPPRPRFSTAC